MPEVDRKQVGSPNNETKRGHRSVLNRSETLGPAHIDRKALEERELQWLAPYAMLSLNSEGRQVEEPHSNYRTEFQRDRDRIIHANAFRRLEYKTQVFVNHEGDHYRTRLTHTLEAAQIGRTIARALCLNEELTEAIILAHDLGHTPFGHAGERVMNDLMQPYGGFEHNIQSLRVVEEIENRYPKFRGLNLTYEVREGIAKHSTPYDAPQVVKHYGTNSPPLEAQIADLADEIAYHNHDVDDGLSSGMLAWEDLEANIPLFAAVSSDVRTQNPDRKRTELKTVIISTMITRLVDDLMTHTVELLNDHSISSIDDVRNSSQRLVAFSEAMMNEKAVLKEYLMQNMYLHWRVVRMEEKAKRILTDLFNAYMSRIQQLPKEYVDHAARPDDLPRLVCDYMAGMTDRYALDEHKRLFDPHEKV